MSSRKIGIIGAGNGGHAFAGCLSLAGHQIAIYDKYLPLLEPIKANGGVKVEGCVQGFGKVDRVCDSIVDVVKDAEIVFVLTTADAHQGLARELASAIKPGQIVVLSPGRTGGALEFRRTFLEFGGTPELLLAEAQTLVYACRRSTPGAVNIIGVKKRVMLSALPASNTRVILDSLNDLFDCFVPAHNVLTTSLENIGAMFHPSVALFNAATIERAQPFYFYRDMTPHIAAFIETVDAVRLAVGRAYGVDLIGVSDWIDYAYPGTQGETLCEKLQNNPAYYDILAPSKIDARQLVEDIPTGVLPIAELGRVAGVDVELYDAIVSLVSNLLKINFRETGRSLRRMGLEGMTRDEILRFVNER